MVKKKKSNSFSFIFNIFDYIYEKSTKENINNLILKPFIVGFFTTIGDFTLRKFFKKINLKEKLNLIE
jgi:hypothetical protein